jgi:hypothetical protein
MTFTDREIRERIVFPTKEDLRQFINNNDSGESLEVHLKGCQTLLKKYEKLENYEYCAILRDYINLKRNG